MLTVVVILIIIIIIIRKIHTRHLQQLLLGTTPQPSVVRHSTYPSDSQQVPQLSADGETTNTSSVPISNYDTEHTAKESTINPSVSKSAVKTTTFQSDYPYRPPPYNPSYCKNECIPDRDVPPPSYSSVVSSSPTVQISPAS